MKKAFDTAYVYCLCPILFLVFINDMAKFQFSGKLYLYADDTVLFYKGRDAVNNCVNMNRNLKLRQVEHPCNE